MVHQEVQWKTPSIEEPLDLPGRCTDTCVVQLAWLVSSRPERPFTDEFGPSDPEIPTKSGPEDPNSFEERQKASKSVIFVHFLLKTRRGGEHRRGEGSKTFLEENGFLEGFRRFLSSLFFLLKTLEQRRPVKTVLRHLQGMSGPDSSGLGDSYKWPLGSQG